MLPLASPSPRSTHELAEALTQGLAAHGAPAVVLVEGDWPELARLRIDFTRLSQPKLLTAKQAQESLRFAEVEFAGHPMLVEGVPIELAARFVAVRAGIAAGEPAQLVMLGATDGSLRLEAHLAEVERALHTIIARLAEAQGATIKAVRLSTSTPDARTIEFSVEATAKVFLATATLTVRGRVEIDDTLTARVADLSLSGEGLMASLAQGFLAPQLAAWRGREFALGTYVAAGLRVCDVRLSAGEVLRLEADFAGA